ncbi:hypothetical protein [Streptomyces sp. NBC_01563]|uniref:hypothetical protein n=1 Tax=Streptomyces sp. NBC_01563 TaxID=2975880 RepID=UPI003863D3A7
MPGPPPRADGGRRRPVDIPAVRTLATTLALGTPQDTDTQNAYEQIRAAWTTAGIH